MKHLVAILSLILGALLTLFFFELLQSDEHGPLRGEEAKIGRAATFPSAKDFFLLNERSSGCWLSFTSFTINHSEAEELLQIERGVRMSELLMFTELEDFFRYVNRPRDNYPDFDLSTAKNAVIFATEQGGDGEFWIYDFSLARMFTGRWSG